MTSLPTLIISFALTGLALTFLTRMAGKTKNLFWSFLQYFCGVWFVFSGAVKAIDPIGTAYKMEDYFAAFEVTFEGLNNSLSGLAGLFPRMAGYSTGFSILMIVLEIVLGVLLIIGHRKKLTAWLFFLLVAFFTVLTGFTFLTGYVPIDANFFDFGQWGPYVKTQMRVTDCGCFGDFIKLDPKISFFKDIGLIVPAVLFLIGARRMHTLFTDRGRSVITAATTAFSLVFCLWNTYLNLPVVDFRPFRENVNIRDQKALEAEARANMEIIGWILKNDSTGESLTFMEPVPGEYTYYKQYPKAQGWSVVDQIKTEPFIEKDGKRIEVAESKISDFAIEYGDQGEVTDDILNEEGYSLMIIAYKLKGEEKMGVRTVQDTTWAVDTVSLGKDSLVYLRKPAGINSKQIEQIMFVPSDSYKKMFLEKVNPLAEAASSEGWKVFGITTYADAEFATDFKSAVEANYPFYKGDDKLLKTIIRANPGIVVLKDGKVVAKYHHRHIPTFEQIRK